MLTGIWMILLATNSPLYRVPGSCGSAICVSDCFDPQFACLLLQAETINITSEVQTSTLAILRLTSSSVKDVAERIQLRCPHIPLCGDCLLCTRYSCRICRLWTNASTKAKIAAWAFPVPNRWKSLPNLKGPTLDTMG